jgi:hypothetical protein
MGLALSPVSSAEAGKTVVNNEQPTNIATIARIAGLLSVNRDGEQCITAGHDWPIRLVPQMTWARSGRSLMNNISVNRVNIKILLRNEMS